MREAIKDVVHLMREAIKDVVHLMREAISQSFIRSSSEAHQKLISANQPKRTRTSG